MNNALGLIEIKGLAGAVTVADIMVKTANVELIGIEKAKGLGWITVKIAGDVGAVTASVSAGQTLAQTHNQFVSAKVIPRPSQSIAEVFCNPGSDSGTPQQNSTFEEPLPLDPLPEEPQSLLNQEPACKPEQMSLPVIVTELPAEPDLVFESIQDQQKEESEKLLAKDVVDALLHPEPEQTEQSKSKSQDQTEPASTAKKPKGTRTGSRKGKAKSESLSPGADKTGTEEGLK